MEKYHFSFSMFADDKSNLGTRVQSFDAETAEDAQYLAVEYCKHLFAAEGPKSIEVGVLKVESVKLINDGDL